MLDIGWSEMAVIALVAEVEGEIVGHILFSPVRLDGAGEIAKRDTAT